MNSTGYIQTELMTCCLGRKHKSLVLFWKIFNSYVYDLVDCDTINNSGRYFTCVDLCKKAILGREILVIQ